MTKTCMDCKFSISEDYGYSNYTVEGTQFFCGKHAHPEAPFDRFYGDNPKLKFAETCTEFEEGQGIDMDCDGENYADLTDEQKEIYNNKD